MRKLKFSMAALACMLFVISSCENQQEQLVGSDDLASINVFHNKIPDQYIVVLNDPTRSRNLPLDYDASQALVRDEVMRIIQDGSLQADISVERVYSNALKGFSGKMSAVEVSKLLQDSRVAYIEQDQQVSIMQGNKPPKGGGGSAAPQETPWGITRVGGGANYTGSGVAFIIDSGIDLDHPDLNVDASLGFNAFDKGRDGGAPDDGNGHGTHVAGTIAAINNSVGVIGVAAGAKVVPIKVLDSRGSGSYSGVIAGVDWVGSKGKSGDVANMSLGGPVSQALDDAVIAAASNGIRFFLAAGNEASDANNSSPSRANCSNCYTISAMNSSDVFASFSNFGNPPVDYCAPGVSISSTWKDGGYNTISGTSMASPHAAGVWLFGSARTSGTVLNDPDGNADPIISR
jgi:subtilisin family serine protease